MGLCDDVIGAAGLESHMNMYSTEGAHDADLVSGWGRGACLGSCVSVVCDGTGVPVFIKGREHSCVVSLQQANK